MRRLFLYSLAMLGILLMAHPAEARKKHRHHHRVHVTQQVQDSFNLFGFPFSNQAHTEMDQASPTSSTRPWSRKAGHSEGVRYLPHPSGCPSRLFCGCGAAVKLFGKPVRELWLVKNWSLRFPRTSAAPGMAAITKRRGGGHIVVLDRHVSGSVWMVYDYNSGGRRSRYHARSIAGYHIVNPHGSRYSSL